MAFPAAGMFGLFDEITPSGREKKAASKEQRVASHEMRQMAKQLFEGTGGLREETTGLMETFLQTGELPAMLGGPASLTPSREALESQFGVARENVLSRTPVRGGQLNEALTNVETARAQSIAGLTEEARRAELPLRTGLLEGAIRTGFNQGPVAISGLNASAGQFGNVANRALMEQLEREKRTKDEVVRQEEQMGEMMGMMGMFMGGGG